MGLFPIPPVKTLIKNKDLTKGIKTAERREKLHVANIKENLIEFGGIIDYKGMIEK